MQRFFNNLKLAYNRKGIHIQLISINVVVFLLVTLFSILMLLFKKDSGSFLVWLKLPASLDLMLHRPWTLISYMFLHEEFLHLLFNMLWLFWFGQLFLHFFSSKHLRGLYVMGGLGGALLYAITYNIFPYFEDQIPYALLLGASASVIAIVVATAYKSPNYGINLLFLGTVKLKYIALLMLSVDLLMIKGEQNIGGHVAHLGGALTGLLFASCLQKGRDITHWINVILDSLLHLLDKETWKRKKRKPTMKVHFAKRKQDMFYNEERKQTEAEVDRILEKLKQTGYQNLSEAEKRTLFDASKRT